MYMSVSGGIYLRPIHFRVLCYRVIFRGFVTDHECESRTEFHENPANCLVDKVIEGQTDARTEVSSTKGDLFLVPNESLIMKMNIIRLKC